MTRDQFGDKLTKLGFAESSGNWAYSKEIGPDVEIFVYEPSCMPIEKVGVGVSNMSDYEREVLLKTELSFDEASGFIEKLIGIL